MTDNAVEVPAPEADINMPEDIAPPKQNSNDDDKKYSSEIVTKIVKRERDKAYEKGKREALMELQQQQQPAAPEVQQQPVANNAAMQAPQPVANQQPQNIGGMPQVSPDQIKQLIMQHAPEAFANHVKQVEQQNLVNSFVSKMKAAEAKYPGLEKKLNELDMSTIAPLIKHIDNMDNSGDIMNELIENPMKMGNLVSLIYTQPKLAEKAIQNLSSSIKMNDDAKAADKSSQDPFSQQKPSLNAGKDDGDMSVADFQAMFKKRRG